MDEKVKRLEPTKDTLRELFLKSGNECAFPGCHHKLISSDGIFLGQICHIEAAKGGGERFNPNLTNEQRRAFSNLLLLCHAHHKVTDDISKYTVERLKEIKTQHEAKFTDIISSIQNSFTDHTDFTTTKPARYLSEINKVLEWDHTPGMLNGTQKVVNAFANRLKNLPIQARQFFSLMIKRSKFNHSLGQHIYLHELQLITGANENQVQEIIQVLNKYGFIQEGYPDENNLLSISVKKIDGWHFTNDLKHFCELTSLQLDEILVDLNFSLLD